MLNICILAAGVGQRFKNAGYKNPKPMIDVCGKPMIERVIENLTPKYREHRFVIVTLAATTSQRMTDILRKHHSTIIELPYLTEGATVSTLKAENIINTSDSLLLSSCDQLVDIDIDEFIDTCWRSDGGILTKPNSNPPHHYCYVEVKDGLVVRVAERQPISTHAAIGQFFYKRGSDFVSNAKKMIRDNVRYNCEFYNMEVFNYLVRKGLKIVIHEISAKKTHMLGTPKELEEYVRGRKLK